jgi:uncharacterized membrane protein
MEAVEATISLVLRGGVILSASIICLGLVLLFAEGALANGARIDAAIAYPRDATALLAGLCALDPVSIIVFGLLVLIATPVVRVAVSILAFACSRDWLYALITALVLVLLVAGMYLGVAVR